MSNLVEVYLTKTPQFLEGVISYLEGKPLETDGMMIDHAILFEQGRLFAAYCKGKGKSPYDFITKTGSIISDVDMYYIVKYELETELQLGWAI